MNKSATVEREAVRNERLRRMGDGDRGQRWGGGPKAGFGASSFQLPEPNRPQCAMADRRGQKREVMNVG